MNDCFYLKDDAARVIEISRKLKNFLKTFKQPVRKTGVLMFFRTKTLVRIFKKTFTTPDNILNCFSVIKRSESENPEGRSFKRGNFSKWVSLGLE